MNLPNNTLLQGGKYKIVRFISSGGFGCTYEAEHTMLHKRVAIKEFFVKDFCNRDEQTSHVTVGTQTKVALVSKLRKKFVEEAVALSQFQHENIVRVSDVFEENGTAYYVMDFVNGRSLHEILKTESTIPESRAVKYICQVAHALRYVHAQNRLHLDIKPGNIMIDDRDNAVLIDFGTSKQYDEEAGENTSTLLGKTPGYAPIEQMGNSVQNFTPATDIYSLGATLYKMLTGITPPETNLLVSDDEALKPLPTYITPATRKAVEQAMQVKRKDRPQSIDELLAIIGTTINKEGMKKPAPKPVAVDDEATILDTGHVETRKLEPNPVTATATPTISQTASQPITPKPAPRTNTVSETEDNNDTPKIVWGFIAIVAMVIYSVVQCNGGASSSRNDYSSQQTTAPAPKQDSTAYNITCYDAKGNSFTYTGKVKYGKPNGEGTGWYSYGKYVGKYYEGYRWGEGEFTYQDGSQTFKGTFVKDNYDKGTIRLSDGTYFTGTFNNGQPYNGNWYNAKGQVISQVVYGK